MERLPWNSPPETKQGSCGKVLKRWNNRGKGLFYTVTKYDSLLYWSSSLVAFDHQSEQIKPEGILKKCQLDGSMFSPNKRIIYN